METTQSFGKRTRVVQLDVSGLRFGVGKVKNGRGEGARGEPVRVAWFSATEKTNFSKAKAFRRGKTRGRGIRGAALLNL